MLIEPGMVLSVPRACGPPRAALVTAVTPSGITLRYAVGADDMYMLLFGEDAQKRLTILPDTEVPDAMWAVLAEWRLTCN